MTARRFDCAPMRVPEKCRRSVGAAAALLFLLLMGAASIAAAPAVPAGKSGDVLYEDATANSAATITQVLPNSATSQMTLEHVSRIRIQQNVIIIEWGGTATTLLPQQYVSAIAINRHNAPAATAPAAHESR